MSRGPIPDKANPRPSVPEVVAMIQAFYQHPAHGVGGALHIVLDDHNLGQDTIRYCREYAAYGCHCGRTPCQDAIDIADALLAMTGTQIRRVMRLT